MLSEFAHNPLQLRIRTLGSVMEEAQARDAGVHR
jgi:hypothetical protein